MIQSGCAGHPGMLMTEARTCCASGAQESAAFALVELQSGRIAGIRCGSRDSTPARTVADRDDDRRGRGQPGDPFEHRAAGEHIHRTGAVRPADHGAFEYEDVQRPCAGGAVGEYPGGVVAEFHTQRRMPQQLRPKSTMRSTTFGSSALRKLMVFLSRLRPGTTARMTCDGRPFLSVMLYFDSVSRSPTALAMVTA